MLRRYKNVNPLRVVSIPSPTGGSLIIRPGDIITQESTYMDKFLNYDDGIPGIEDLGPLYKDKIEIPVEVINPIAKALGKFESIPIKELNTSIETVLEFNDEIEVSEDSTDGFINTVDIEDSDDDSMYVDEIDSIEFINDEDLDNVTDTNKVTKFTDKSYIESSDMDKINSVSGTNSSMPISTPFNLRVTTGMDLPTKRRKLKSKATEELLKKK